MLALPTAYKQVGTYSGTVGDSHCHSVDGGPSVLGIRIPNSSRNAGTIKRRCVPIFNRKGYDGSMPWTFS